MPARILTAILRGAVRNAACILELSLVSSFARDFSFLFARRVPFPKNGFSPAFKNRNKFLFFPFFVFFSLGSFFLARWETQGQRLSSARDQSRKIKDFLEHWLERFRVSRTARESNPIEEGKYIETRTNEWGSKRESTIPRPRVRFRSFPPCHLGALPTRYARDLCLLGEGVAHRHQPENRAETVLKRFSATKIYPRLEASPLMPLISSSTHASSSTALQCTLFIFFSFFRVSSSCCQHTSHAYVAITNTNLRYYLYLVSVEISSLKKTRYV